MGVLRQCSVSMRWQFSKVLGKACTTAGCGPVTKQVFYNQQDISQRIFVSTSGSYKNASAQPS